VDNQVRPRLRFVVMGLRSTSAEEQDRVSLERLSTSKVLDGVGLSLATVVQLYVFRPFSAVDDAARAVDDDRPGTVRVRPGCP